MHEPPNSILSVSPRLPGTAKVPAGHCVAQMDIIPVHDLSLLHCRVIAAAEWVEAGEICINIHWSWAIPLLDGHSCCGGRTLIWLAISAFLGRAPKLQPLKDLLAGRAAVRVLPHALCDEVCHPLGTLLRHPASTSCTLGHVPEYGQIAFDANSAVCTMCSPAGNLSLQLPAGS